MELKKVAPPILPNTSLLGYSNRRDNDDAHSNLTSASPRCSISTRHSSVSIQYPIDTGLSSNLILPHNRLTNSRLSAGSRFSAGSAWDSFRLSVVSFSKVFLVAPCSRHKCCLGCVSLHDAIPLICAAEMFTFVFLTMIVLDFWITDGKTFYTCFFEGYGTKIALYYSVFLAISIPILLLTLIAWKKKVKSLYIFHILWQWTVIEMLTFYGYTIFNWVQEAGGAHANGILVPSAIVLSTAAFVGAVVEFWWLFVFVNAMFFTPANDSQRYSLSIHSKRASQKNRDCESIRSDSGRNSFAIPIVKVERVVSQDMGCNDFNGPKEF